MTTEPDTIPDARAQQAGASSVLTAVLANRFETIVREMTNTLFRAGRSSVLNTARDFSCCVVTSDDQLLAAAEGLQAHVLGAGLQTRWMGRLHPDMAEGDAFLHNDPHLGNTHGADHTLLVPVFIDGEHFLTVSAKAHQADCGNSAPSTYMPFATDVYEEGLLTFPCVRVQRDYSDVDDIIRMCRARIRVPDVWYGDYLAAIGAVRVGERRLKELVDKYGIETLREFIAEWLDYSERRDDPGDPRASRLPAPGLEHPRSPSRRRREGDGQCRNRGRPGRREDRGRPARQRRLSAVRPELIGGLRDGRGDGRRLQLPPG